MAACTNPITVGFMEVISMEDLISQLEQRIRNLEERVAKVEAPPPKLGKGTTVRIAKGKNAGLTGVVKWTGTSDYNGEPRVGVSVQGRERLVYAAHGDVEIVQ